MGLKKYFSVSNNILLFSFLTSSTLIIAFFVINHLDYNILKVILESGIPYAKAADKISNFDVIRFSSYAFGLITFITGALILLIKQSDEAVKNNPIAEALFISFSFVSITMLLFIAAVYLFLFIPSTVTYLLVIFIVFFASLLKSLISRLNSSDNGLDAPIWKNYELKLIKFGFPYFKLIWLVSAMFSIFVGLSTRGQNNFSFLNYIGFIIGVLGLVYLVLGRHYRLKRLDEFKRIIILEQSNIFLGFVMFFLFGSLLLAANFRMEIHLSDAMILFGPAIIISLVLAENKYK